MTDLINIARSGLTASRASLEVTAQNIANANTPGYVRRSVRLAEVVTQGKLTSAAHPALSGVRITGVSREVEEVRSAEVRRTGAEAGRAEAEVDSLDSLERVFQTQDPGAAISAFTAALTELTGSPANIALRSVALAEGDGAASRLRSAAAGVAGVREELVNSVDSAAGELTALAADLQKLNAAVGRTRDGTHERAGLFDQRDLILEKMADIVGISVSFLPTGGAEVRVGDASGPALTTATGSATVTGVLGVGDALSVDIGGTVVVPASGRLAGLGQGLEQASDARIRLDAVATTLMGSINTAQAAGSDLDGNPGAALFSGTGAADIALTTSDPSRIAAAFAGAPAGSRDNSNLRAMLQQVADDGATDSYDSLVGNLATTVAHRRTTAEAAGFIHDSAVAARNVGAAVSLDEEASNLIRQQQAFQASGRVIQVAREIIDSLLAIG